MLNELLTIHEAAEYLRVSTFTIRRAVKANNLEVYRIGNAEELNRRPMRFTRDSLDRYAMRTVSSTQLVS